MFKAIVVFVSLTGGSFQLEDELGPYSDEAKCLYRGAQIIKVTSMLIVLQRWINDDKVMPGLDVRKYGSKLENI